VTKIMWPCAEVNLCVPNEQVLYLPLPISTTFTGAFELFYPRTDSINVVVCMFTNYVFTRSHIYKSSDQMWKKLKQDLSNNPCF
jgi:hypothetical protein